MKIALTHLLTGGLLLLGLCFSPRAMAQTDSIPETDSLLSDAPRVFLDCNYCDQDYIRQNLPWVNYVRDRRLADVHVLATRQSTGAGGSEFTFSFIGQERFQGMNDTMVWVAQPMQTNDERRVGRTRLLKMGLIRYAARTNILESFDVSFDQPVEPTDVDDPWNNWVYRISASAWFNGEESYQSLDMWNSVSADHITPDWKIELSASMSYDESSFDIGDEVITNVQRSQYFNSRVARSINDHWSVGGYVNGSSSIFDNLKLQIGSYGGVEYNVYPYAESTRRQLRIAAHVGYEHRNYNDTTIYEVVQDRLPGSTLGVAYSVQEKWGSINTSISGNAFLHDLSKNSVRVWSSLNIRLFTGFTFRISGNVSLIRNQLGLVKGDASEEDILLRQRAIATNYRYWGNVGFTYTFGSIYNSVVNPRFGG